MIASGDSRFSWEPFLRTGSGRIEWGIDDEEG